jgi:hypothetical protein
MEAKNNKKRCLFKQDSALNYKHFIISKWQLQKKAPLISGAIIF